MTKIPKKIKKLNLIKPLTAKQKHRQLVSNLKNNKKQTEILNIHLKEMRKVTEKVNKFFDKNEKFNTKVETFLDNELKKLDN